MKKSNSKIIWLVAALFVSFNVSVAGQTRNDKIADKYQSWWHNLIPTYTKLQYAGSMGFLSLGTGWDYGKNNQWETDVMFGFLPRYNTDAAKMTFTLKQNFIPWKTDLGKNFELDPLACGVYATSIFHEEFWRREPGKYPNGYYTFFVPKIRFNFYIGQRIRYNIPPNRNHYAKSITFFYEISSNELYIVSRFGNQYLKPTDYIHLSLGLKLQIL